MAAPFPREVRTKDPLTSQKAKEIYAHYAWLARWSDELCMDEEINRKKLAQLAYGEGSHCAWFVRLTQNMTPDLAAALAAKFALEGLGWPSAAEQKADLDGIRSAAEALHAYVMKDVPYVAEMSKIEMSNRGPAEVVIMDPKPHPVMDLVSNLRAEFES